MPCGVRAGLAALAFVMAAAAPASGQDSTGPAAQSQSIDGQLSQYRQRYADVSANEVELIAQLDVARQARDAATAELTRLDASVQQAVAALGVAQQASAAAQQQAAAAAAHLLDARAKAAAAQDVLRRQAVDAYIGQGRFGVLTVTLQHTDQDEALAASYYAEMAGGVQADRVNVAQATREAAVAAESTAAFTAARAASTQADLARKQAAVQQARDAQAVAQQQAAADVTNHEQALASLQSQKAAYAAQVDQLQADAQQIAAMLRQRAAPAAPAGPVQTGPPRATATPKATAAPAKATASPTKGQPTKGQPTTAQPAAKPAPPATTAKAPATTANTPVATTAKPAATTAPAPGPGTTFPPDYSTANPPVSMALSWPLPGWPLIGRFAMGVDPVLGVYRMHEGIDIGGPEGAPIHAAGGGTVIWAGDRHGYGNAVFIDHGSGVVTVYAHQSKIGVSVGQHVSTGDVIGYVGHTGLAAGPHLHFEVRVNGTAYDPLKFVSPR